MNKRRKLQKINPVETISIIILLAVTSIFIFPFYWVITGAFKTQRETVALPPNVFPQAPTLENFEMLFNQPAWRWLFNSILVAGVSMVLVCLVSTSAGYALAKKRFTGSKLLFSVFVAAMALPKQVVLVPLVRQINMMGFHNTLLAAILPAVGWPFSRHRRHHRLVLQRHARAVYKAVLRRAGGRYESRHAPSKDWHGDNFGVHKI